MQHRADGRRGGRVRPRDRGKETASPERRHGETAAQPAQTGIGEIGQSSRNAGLVDQVAGQDEERHRQQGKALVEHVEKLCPHIVEGEAQHEGAADHPIGDDQQHRHADHEEKGDPERDQCNPSPIGHAQSPPITACRISGSFCFRLSTSSKKFCQSRATISTKARGAVTRNHHCSTSSVPRTI